MRLVALMAIALGCAGAGQAAAQTFASRPDPALDALNRAAFAPKTASADVAPGSALIEREGYVAGQGPLVYRSGEVRLSNAADEGPVDSIRINVGGALVTPGGAPLNLQHSQFRADDIDVTLVRRWPGAVSVTSRGLAFDVSPHAGVGVSRLGGQAEGGAMLTVSRSREQAAVERLKALGVRDGESFGREGRWYLFAAADGRAVGLNMLHDAHGWDRAGWSTDPTGALVGDAQVGVGWRKGDVQSSFGVIHREVKGQHMIFGQQTRDDTVAAFTFSIRPGR